MKKYLLAVCLTTTSLMASAQFVTSGENKMMGSTSSTEDYNSFRFSYSPTTIDAGTIGAIAGALGMSLPQLNGFSLEYTRGINIVNDLPLFLEVGAGVKLQNATFSSEEEDDMYIYKYKYSLNVASLYIPLNVGYKIAITEDFAIMPYVGLMTQFNLSATATNSYEKDYHKEFEDFLGYKDESGKESQSLFDKKEMGENTFRRLFFGWQVGANIAIKDFHIGANYGTTLGRIVNNIEGVKLKGATISIGYNF